MALRGKATQSARFGDSFGAAYNAIDGNHESNYGSGSCAHSTEMRNPWWRVDLLESYIITSITIVNREDCCKHRINGMEVHIGNSVERNGFENPVWVNMKNNKSIFSNFYKPLFVRAFWSFFPPSFFLFINRDSHRNS